MTVATVKTRLENLIAMARLLERIDANPLAVGAEQYRTLVRQVTALLDDDLPPEAMQAVLQQFPATATLYENLHYEQAGLSRASLEWSVSSEMLAHQWLHKAAGRGTGDDAAPAA